MRPPKFTQAVWDELDQDLHLQAALSRGLLNAHAVARVLKERLGLDASIPGVVSAIKRYPLADYSARYERAREALRGIRITTRTKVVAIALRKDPRAFSVAARLLDAVDVSKGEAIRIIQTEESVLVIVDQPKQEALLALVPDDQLVGVRQRLAQVSVQEPGWSTNVPGPLFLITGALFAQGIAIWGLLSAAHEVLVLIAEEDLARAHRTLIRLAESRPEPAPTTTGRPPRPATVRRRPA